MSATVYSPGRALTCTSSVTVTSFLSAAIVAVFILIGFGNESAMSVTLPLNSGHKRSHFTTTSTFFPASTSIFSTAGVIAKGVVSPAIATTNSRVGRLDGVVPAGARARRHPARGAHHR